MQRSKLVEMWSKASGTSLGTGPFHHQKVTVILNNVHPSINGASMEAWLSKYGHVAKIVVESQQDDDKQQTTHISKTRNQCSVTFKSTYDPRGIVRRPALQAVLDMRADLHEQDAFETNLYVMENGIVETEACVEYLCLPSSPTAKEGDAAVRAQIVQYRVTIDPLEVPCPIMIVDGPIKSMVEMEQRFFDFGQRYGEAYGGVLWNVCQDKGKWTALLIFAKNAIAELMDACTFIGSMRARLEIRTSVDFPVIDGGAGTRRRRPPVRPLTVSETITMPSVRVGGDVPIH